MVESTSDNDDLTPAQEYAIASGVILLFGLLYWFLNNGGDGLTSTALPTAQTITHQAAPVLETQAVETVNGSVNTRPINVAAAPVAAAALPPPAAVNTTAPAVVTTHVAPAAQTAAPALATTVIPAPLAQHGLGTSAKGALGTPSPVPNGKTLDIGTSGFGGIFRDAIAKRQTDRPIVLDGIYFDSGSSKPNAQSIEQINVIVALLQANPDIRLLIRGHTDEVGSAKENTELSLVRANEVGVALVQAGVDRKRLRIMGMGNAEPISIDNTDFARQRNRRIDALILK
jgi:outer membrane protein OmpA-like peptidoglycan-associated protein